MLMDDPITLSEDDWGVQLFLNKVYIGSITILRRWLDPREVEIQENVWSKHFRLFRRKFVFFWGMEYPPGN